MEQQTIVITAMDAGNASATFWAAFGFIVPRIYPQCMQTHPSITQAHTHTHARTQITGQKNMKHTYINLNGKQITNLSMR